MSVLCSLQKTKASVTAGQAFHIICANTKSTADWSRCDPPLSPSFTTSGRTGRLTSLKMCFLISHIFSLEGLRCEEVRGVGLILMAAALQSCWRKVRAPSHVSYKYRVKNKRSDPGCFRSSPLIFSQDEVTAQKWSLTSAEVLNCMMSHTHSLVCLLEAVRVCGK